MESQNTDSVRKTKACSIGTPHKEILPIRHVMEISPLAAVIGIAPSVRRKHGSVGSRPESGNFFRPHTSMWCSACLIT